MRYCKCVSFNWNANTSGLAAVKRSYVYACSCSHPLWLAVPPLCAIDGGDNVMMTTTTARARAETVRFAIVCMAPLFAVELFSFV